MIITIDGPCASGKSSVARAIAHNHGYHHLQTGLFYRAAAYVILSRHAEVDSSDIATVKEAFLNLSDADLENISRLEYRCDDNSASMWFGGIDITTFLKVVGMDQPASLIAMVQEVRERLIKAQQAVADRYDIVADGRDCGSVVFPDAEFKFYLTASIEARAARLLHDADRKAQGLTVQEAIDEIHERDERDMSRKVAPLATPNGAIIIDNSDLDFDQTVARLEYFIKPH